MRGLSVLVGAAALALSSLVIPGSTAVAATAGTCQYVGPPGADVNIVGGTGPRTDHQPIRVTVRNTSLIASPCQLVVTATGTDVYGQPCGSASMTAVTDARGHIPDLELPPVYTCGAGRDDFQVSFSQPGNPNYGLGLGAGTVGIVNPDASTHTPIGAFFASSNSRVGMFLLESGWAVDRDAALGNAQTKPITVKLYVDGAYKTSVVANKSILAYTPGSQDVQHGFTASIFLGPNGGAHTVCATAVNVGPGTDKQLGCKAVNLSPNPFGHVDQAASSSGGTSVTIKGWDIDPNTAGAIYTHIYVDGKFKVQVKASYYRTDVEKVYHLGNQHGFVTTVTGLAAGKHTVCAYAINVYAGNSNPLLGCKTV